MKNVIFFVMLIVVFSSCKNETNEKVKEATKLVSADLKEVADAAKTKAYKVIDTAKVKEKVNKAIVNSAEAVEKGAKKLKESVKK